MKKLLIFFLLLSLVLPTQASASACLYPHLAYQKGKTTKLVKKKIQKCTYEGKEWFFLALLSLVGLGMLLGTLVWAFFFFHLPFGFFFFGGALVFLIVFFLIFILPLML